MSHHRSTPGRYVSAILPWFRVVFGTIGTLFPRLLGRSYGLSSPETGSYDVALRYASIRAVGLGIGQLLAPPDRQRDWDRVALLVDTLDTLMVIHAGVRGRISGTSALVMLCGTMTGLLGGLLVELTRGEVGDPA